MAPRIPFPQRQKHQWPKRLRNLQAPKTPRSDFLMSLQVGPFRRVPPLLPRCRHRLPVRAIPLPRTSQSPCRRRRRGKRAPRNAGAPVPSYISGGNVPKRSASTMPARRAHAAESLCALPARLHLVRFGWTAKWTAGDRTDVSRRVQAPVRGLLLGDWIIVSHQEHPGVCLTPRGRPSSPSDGS